MKPRLLNLFVLGMMTSLCLHSSSVEAIFASVKSTGMAATCISYPLDTFSGAYNPAGMTDIGDRFDIEAAWVHDTGTATVVDNLPHPGVVGVSGTGAPVFGIIPASNGKYNGMQDENVFPVGFGINKTWCLSCDWELATGLIVYNRNYQKTTYKQPIPALGTTKPGLEYLNETISPIIAIKWCNAHTLGISADFQVERLKVNGIENFDEPIFPGLPGGSVSPGHVTNNGYGWSTGWGVTIGYHGQITDELSIGLTYQPETTMRKIGKYDGFLAQHGRLNIPEKVGGGISYRFIPCLIVAFDVEWIRWSQVKALHNPLLQDGTLEPLGSSDGPGFGFRDQVYYRVGTEWQVNECLALRLGYRYANTPVKSSQTAVNLLLLDMVESFVTTGATWNISENNEVSFVFAYGFEKKMNGNGSIPAFLGGGNVNLKEQKYALGLAWGYNY